MESFKDPKYGVSVDKFIYRSTKFASISTPILTTAVVKQTITTNLNNDQIYIIIVQAFQLFRFVVLYV